MAAQFIIYKETDDQDLAIENGDFVLLEDQDAIVQQVGTVMRLAKFDWFLDLDEGLRYLDGDNPNRQILGDSSLSLENETEIIEKINGVFGVVALVSFNAGFLDDGVTFQITGDITTIFSNVPITVTITV